LYKPVRYNKLLFLSRVLLTGFLTGKDKLLVTTLVE
jgi:hypothetical protein